MAINFTGLISGLDTGSLIDQLVAAQRAAATPLETQKTNLGRQKSIVTDLGSNLRALADAVKAIDTASEVRSVKAQVTDDPHVAVAASGTAATATHTMRVTTTARAQVVSSKTFASQDAGVLSAGGVTISSAGRDPVSVSWGSSDSLADVANRIRGSGAGVDASVLYDGSSYRLVVSARDTGTAAAPTFVDSGDGLDLANPTGVMTPGRNAAFTLDGIPMTRGSNVVSDALTGVTFTLKDEHEVGDADSVLPIVLDKEGARGKLQKLVDAHNAINSQIQGQLSYSGTTKTTATLFGDSMLRGLQLALGNVTTSSHGGATLSGLGVKRDNTGKLTIDTTAFDKALEADGDAVEKLMVTGGLATKLTELTEQYTRSGDGILASKTSGIDARIKLYDNQIASIDKAATDLGARLERQFSALEQAMAQLQSQSGFLSAIL